MKSDIVFGLVVQKISRFEETRRARKICIANRNILFFKQIYFSYSSLCCLFYQARHLRHWDQSAVSILYVIAQLKGQNSG